MGQKFLFLFSLLLLLSLSLSNIDDVRKRPIPDLSDELRAAATAISTAEIPMISRLSSHRVPPLESALAAIKFSGFTPARISQVNSGSGERKRFRTRFSQEQKEKMYEFAEKLGWKLQRIDKRLIEEFCGEIGVGKEVLKVWMHKNKNTHGRREISNSEYNIFFLTLNLVFN